jgi:hypothetical protein
MNASSRLPLGSCLELETELDLSFETGVGFLFSFFNSSSWEELYRVGSIQKYECLLISLQPRPLKPGRINSRSWKRWSSRACAGDRHNAGRRPDKSTVC